MYSSFNLLIRRNPKENNFKVRNQRSLLIMFHGPCLLRCNPIPIQAVLETIRDLMNVAAVGKVSNLPPFSAVTTSL